MTNLYCLARLHELGTAEPAWRCALRLKGLSPCDGTPEQSREVGTVRERLAGVLLTLALWLAPSVR